MLTPDDTGPTAPTARSRDRAPVAAELAKAERLRAGRKGEGSQYPTVHDLTKHTNVYYEID